MPRSTTWSPMSSPSDPPPTDGRLVVMARYPRPGEVKSRLAAVVGVERACALYRAFVLDFADRLRGAPCDVTWAYWPPRAPFRELLPGWRCRPQEGDDLGERLAHVVASELARGGASVVVVGADAPHLPMTCVTEAMGLLAAGADLVLGPAADGGYYLIGLRANYPDLFEGISWGTGTVLAETLARAQGLALRTHLLAPTFDVDEAGDIDSLRAVLRNGDVDLPRTAALLT